MVFALAFDRMGKAVCVWMALIATAFETVLLLDKLDILPFSPYVPSAQKLMIVSFMLWQLLYAVRLARRCGRPSERLTCSGEF